jgi:predicted metal-dependent hydrolase
MTLAGGEVDVHLRRSSRARRLRLVVVPPGLVEVVVPPRVGAGAVERFLDEQRDWLARAVARAGRPARLGLDRPGVLWIGGTPVPARGLRDTCAVERWYRRRARDAVTVAADIESRRLEVEYCRVRIGDQRTRWGSCSRTGTLSFSWRLLLAPAAVLEYVVVHELCHLRELNHSRRFWHLVEAARPDWREHAAWLAEHGHELHAYDPAVALAS